MSVKIPRRMYADLYGPTRGDRVRLADTELIAEVEQDYAVYGDEITFGGGKVIRDGMGQSPLALAGESLDLVITNALIVDAVAGIIKADVGIKNGRIVEIGTHEELIDHGGIYHRLHELQYLDVDAGVDV